MRLLRRLTMIAIIAWAVTPVRADDLPQDWQLVRTCLGKAGFVYGEHWRVIATIEWISGDFDKLNAAYKRCREQVMKEMAAEASESKKK